MKKIMAMIMAAAMVLAVTACGGVSGDTPMGFKAISDEGLDYDLFVPEGWVTDISAGVTSARASENDPTSISVMMFELDGSVSTIPEYWATYEPTLARIFDNFAYVDGKKDGDKVTLDGASGIQYVYTGRLDSSDYKIMQIVAFKGTTAVIFTYTAEEARYQKNGDEAEKKVEIGSYDKNLEDVLAILEYFRFN